VWEVPFHRSDQEKREDVQAELGWEGMEPVSEGWDGCRGSGGSGVLRVSDGYTPRHVIGVNICRDTRRWPNTFLIVSRTSRSVLSSDVVLLRSSLLLRHNDNYASRSSGCEIEEVQMIEGEASGGVDVDIKSFLPHLGLCLTQCMVRML
jgi:hypothetical protein